VPANSKERKAKTAGEPVPRRPARRGRPAITEKRAVSWGEVPRVARREGVRF